MKTVFFRFSIILVSIFIASNGYSQQQFVWDYYKMGITLPDDFKVVKNSDTEFECSGEGMELYMYVFEDGDVTAKDMSKATRELGRDLAFTMKDLEYDVDFNGFEGMYMLGYKDGLQVMVCGLINQINATNFFVVIIFEDGDHVAEEDGIAILRSLENQE